VAKGLGGGIPIGACIGVGDAGTLLQPGNHGTTFGGNPVACAAALAVICTIEADGLLDHVTTLGQKLRDGLAADPRVTEVRGEGLLIGVELASGDSAEVVAAAMAAGFIINNPTPTALRAPTRPHAGRCRRVPRGVARDPRLHPGGDTMTRHFLRDDDLTPEEQARVLALAAELKAAPYDTKPLAGPQTVAMIFDKQTLRTQASFAAGIAELGGHPMLVDGHLAGIGVRESIADVARVLGRQASAIVWRTYAQERIEEMAAYAGVPIVNALTDDFHPCQLLADLLTIAEHKGSLSGLTVAFVGDGACNMGNSWLLAGATAGMHVRISSPEGYVPDLQTAVAGADVVVTDTWISMGKEEEAADRTEVFAGFSVTADLFAQAAPDAIFLHCLPAYRDKEVDAEVIDGPRSVVWDEAENRRHAQKAILAFLLGERP